MSISAFDDPILGGLLGDEEVASFFGVEAELDTMRAFEIALAEAEAAQGVIPHEAAAAIARGLKSFRPDVASLRAGLGRDGVVAPDLVRQMRAVVDDPHGKHVHFGATSQDLIDTSLSLRLKPLIQLIAARIRHVISLLDALSERDGDIETMGHTRMQAAIPVPASRKIGSWRDPLERHLGQADYMERLVCVLHFAGAAGTLDKLGEQGNAVTADLAARLGLEPVKGARHSERDTMATFASWLSAISGSLGKMGMDMALLAQTEVGELRLAGGGGSSAMPHKVNPVGAETVVALARFNATLVSGMHHSIVHENERSGAAWTLEWMLLPQMAVATGAALNTATRLVEGASFRRNAG